MCLPWMRPPRSTQLGRRPERRSRVKGRRPELRAAGTGSSVAPQGGGRAGPAGLGRCDGDQEPRRGLLFLDLESGSGEQPCAGRPEQRQSSNLSVGRPDPSLGRGRRDPLSRSRGGWGAQHETGGEGKFFSYILVAKAGNFIEVPWGGL